MFVWQVAIKKRRGSVAMATVRDLISQLEQVEDKDQSIIFQYFLAEHFDSKWGEKYSPTPEQFDQAVDDLDDESLWEEAYETVNDYLYGLSSSESEGE
jgi:hypothetical protein